MHPSAARFLSQPLQFRCAIATPQNEPRALLAKTFIQ
jgi:hypothetical protein